MTDEQLLPPTKSAPADTAGASVDVRRAVRSPKAILGFFIVVVSMLFADLYLKTWAFEHVAGTPVELSRDAMLEDPHGFWRAYPHEPTVVIHYVLNLQLTTNTGAVFGMGKGGIPVFVGVTVLAVVVIFVVLFRSPANAWPLHLSLALILAGALGNLYDRVKYAAVRDMLHMLPETRLWPWIFNFADAILMIGVGVIFVYTYLMDRDAKNAPSEEPTNA